jgi:serine/threonine protein kinase
MSIGKYQPTKKLATGGMAEVFLAKASGPMGFEKSLVLKRILPHLAEDSHFVGMFLAEAKLAAQLNHPNIAQIFDFGESEGSYYLAMEYIDGPNLRTLLKSARAAKVDLPFVCCAKIISCACEGLAFAHDFVDPETRKPLNLVHRDVSPDNILLSSQGAVKVVDFGIAKAANQEHRTQTGVVKGKIAYMPPEQLQGQPLDRRADVYSLGVVLYELLTGAKPYDATTDVSLMQAILFESLIPARKRRPDLPRTLEQILDRALSKAREQRYPDCRALQSDLERFILSTREPVGQWQLAQLVASVSGAAPLPAPLSLDGRVSNNASGTAADYLSPDTGALTLEPEPPALTSWDEEQSLAPISSRRGPIWKVALACFALFLLGTGAAVHLAKPPPAPLVALQEPLTLAAPQSPDPSPAPQAELPPEPMPVQEPPPALEAQAEVKETSPAVDPAPPAPVPAPTVVPVKPPSRSKLSRRAKSPEPAAPQLSPAKGTLEFRIRPYAIVVLNGKQLGQTPLAPTEVAAGTHTVQLINTDLGKRVTRTVEVRAGQSNVFKANLLEE